MRCSDFEKKEECVFDRLEDEDVRMLCDNHVKGKISRKLLRKRKQYYNLFITTAEDVSPAMQNNLKSAMRDIYKYLEGKADQDGEIEVDIESVYDMEVEKIFFWAKSGGKYWYPQYADCMIKACKELNNDLLAHLALEIIHEQEVAKLW